MGCQCALVAALSEEGDSAAPVPTAPRLLDTRDSVGSQGQDSTSGQYFLVALWTA